MKPLAIIIPAFKSTFFDKALQSIASQTNKNFNLYIGDDNSPENLYSIVEKFNNQINIVYKKFSENLGSHSITKHWERCVEMCNGEEWIWLFSDDDIMSEDCVDTFIKEIEKSKNKFDVYRFNCSIIGGDGNKLLEKSTYPTIQTSYEFLISRLTYKCHSYIVNYIFTKKCYLKYNGFVEFKAAWAADDATWILFGQDKNIFTFNEGEIEWRQSAINISGNKNNLVNRRNKYKGTEQFIQWAYKWAQQNNIQLDNKIVINWLSIMLVSLGYNNVFWAFMKNKAFRKILWEVDYSHQLKFIFSNLYLNRR
jgi:glycosyltransferase involved in cell wall biosynthesis